MPHLIGPLVLAATLLAAAPAVAQQSTLVSDTAAEATASAATTVYHAPDIMPTFPGGSEALRSFLKAKLRYPEEALRKGLSGKVYVQFVVDERGHLLEPQVVKGLAADLDAEALRLVRIMPWWTPGSVAGQPVRVAYTLPIVFRALE
ncbi:energy transducer TonB [Solirubrum puertoriconensis]|uniref:TonB C-terminal domain-containing protein n=1 Tax=Solirubrum puertoriconensis TaxID=1751427 RepID=A0A9X0L6J7_SOLP1|nr:energy transducer TonB [Solirubrum puertoriconensis]KUG09816.1 hypothetical protein ASU33_19285 [Solirubrum puertoriconensis]